jgi:hypothetical protein
MRAAGCVDTPRHLHPRSCCPAEAAWGDMNVTVVLTTCRGVCSVRALRNALAVHTHTPGAVVLVEGGPRDAAIAVAPARGEQISATGTSDAPAGEILLPRAGNHPESPVARRPLPFRLEAGAVQFLPGGSLLAFRRQFLGRVGSLPGLRCLGQDATCTVQPTHAGAPPRAVGTAETFCRAGVRWRSLVGQPCHWAASVAQGGLSPVFDLRTLAHGGDGLADMTPWPVTFHTLPLALLLVPVTSFVERPTTRARPCSLSRVTRGRGSWILFAIRAGTRARIAYRGHARSNGSERS